MNVHNIIHNNPKIEISQMSINWRMDKQNVVYPYNIVSFIHKKEWSADLCHNVEESKKHYIS